MSGINEEDRVISTVYINGIRMIEYAEYDALWNELERMKSALTKIAANDSIDSECAGLEEIARKALQA